MTERDELARSLCDRMQQRRLTRIGEPVPENSVPFEHLPQEDQNNWLDLADTVLEMAGSSLTVKLRRAVDDFDRYHRTLAADKTWRNEMLRAMIIEMRVELDRIWNEIQ